MINVQQIAGAFSPARGRVWTEVISALDGAGVKPDNAMLVMYSMYWRTMGGKIYASAAPIENNEVTIVVPVGYMSPQTTVVYLDVFWSCSDGSITKYGSFMVNVMDEPDTAQTVVPIATAPYPIYFMSEGLPVVGELLSSMAYRVPAGGGVVTLLAGGSKKAPEGSDCEVEMTVDGVPSMNVLTLTDGTTMIPEEEVSIALPAGSIIRWNVNEVGSTYEGEDVYAWIMFMPNGQ